MELTRKQEEGLKIAVGRYLAKAKHTVISGYAGAGKSTLIKYIIEALTLEGIDPDKDVVFTAFTGKACNVMQKKGNKNVCTLHKLLYKSIPLPTGGFHRIPMPIGSLPYKIVIVDEVSMAPLELMTLLFKHPVYVICCGDPFQLPPVDKDSDNKLLNSPHIFLDQIMRQAAESEIIQLTMKIRAGEPIHNMSGEEIKIISKNELSTGHLFWADQILVATNNTRHSINNQMRELLGRGDAPEDGDKVICLRNYWDDLSMQGEPLVNGTIGILKNSYSCFIELPPKFRNLRIPVISTDFITDGDEFYEALDIDRQLILTGKEFLDYKQKFSINRFGSSWMVPKEFAYGYAITCHKAQGSEWDKVLVLEEAFPFDKEEHARWLYTACTRASEKLVLVRKD